MDNFEHVIDGIGLWSEVLSLDKQLLEQPALFLDRDGTIVEEEDYLHEPKKVKLRENIGSLIKSCNLINIPVIEITNQSGIGKGYYDWNSFTKTEKQIRKILLSDEAKINMLCACAYHHEAKGKYKVADHSWRKPNPGMLLEAQKIFKIDMSKSWIIGDSLSDIQAGITAGIKGGIYLNAEDKNFKSSNGFKLKYKSNLEDFSWLINDLNNSIF